MSDAMQRNDKRIETMIIPMNINLHGELFTKGNLIGRGGFSQCFDFKSAYTGISIAVKCIQKPKNTKMFTLMNNEMNIHKSVRHENVLELMATDADEHNNYMIFKKMANKTLCECMMWRKNLTEPEIRYHAKHILDGLEYLHSLGVIHRDIKLANIFLNEKMIPKIGDFGLSQVGDSVAGFIRGTAAYLAQELFLEDGKCTNKVDMWSMGCMVYFMRYNSSPFEGGSKQDVFRRITEFDLRIPQEGSEELKSFIKSMLHPNPQDRVSASQAKVEPFMTSGYIPPYLPQSCINMEPRFPEINESSCSNEEKSRQLKLCFKKLQQLCELGLELGRKVMDKNNETVENLSPSANPIYWVRKYIKGARTGEVAYTLSDYSIGFLYQNKDRMTLSADGDYFTCIDEDDVDQYYNVHDGQIPETFTMTLKAMNEFQSYTNLFKNDFGGAETQGTEFSRLPNVKYFDNNDIATSFVLTDGSIQIELKEKKDQKVMISEKAFAVTIMKDSGTVNSYNFRVLQRFGFPKVLEPYLAVANNVMKKVITEMVTRQLARNASGNASGNASN